MLHVRIRFPLALKFFPIFSYVLHFNVYCNMRLIQFYINFNHHLHIFMLYYITGTYIVHVCATKFVAYVPCRACARTITLCPVYFRHSLVKFNSTVLRCPLISTHPTTIIIIIIIEKYGRRHSL